MPKFMFFLPKHIVSTARKGSGCYFFHASNLGFLLSSLNVLSMHGSGMRDDGGTLSPTGGVFLKHRATKLTFQGQDLGRSPTLACTRSLLQAPVLPFSKSLATTPSPPHTPRASLILTHTDGGHSPVQVSPLRPQVSLIPCIPSSIQSQSRRSVNWLLEAQLPSGLSASRLGALTSNLLLV